MSKVYEYIVSVVDKASGAMRKIASNSQSSFGKINKSYSKFQNKSNQVAKSVDDLQKRLDKLKKLRNGTTSVRWIKTLNQGIRDTERRLRKLKELPPANFLQRLKNLAYRFKDLIGFSSAFAVGMGLWNGVKSLFNLGVQAEQTKTKFDVLLGSTQKADKLLSEINQYANATPYQNAGLEKNAELLLAFGMAGNKVVPTLSMLGDVAMGNQEKLNGLSLAYAQVQSTGKLMGQDLLQMINQGFNPLKTISEHTGISMGVLKEKMAKGAISAEMVSRAFELATGKGGDFYKMSEKMSKTAGGRLSTIMGKLNLYAKKLGLKLLNLTMPLIRFVEKGVEYLPKLYHKFSSLIRWLDESIFYIGLLGLAFGVLYAKRIPQLILGLGKYVKVLKLQALWTKITAGWNSVLNAIMDANPYVLVVVGIIALIGVMVLLWNKFEKFRGIVIGTWEVLKLFGTIIKDYVVSQFKNLLSGITGVGKSLMHFFKGEWSEAWKTGKSAVADMLNNTMTNRKDVWNKAKLVGEKFSSGYEKGLNAKKIKLPKISNLFSKNRSKSNAIEDGFVADKTGFESLFDNSSNGGGTNNKIKSGISGITGGGSKQTHITVNLGKLQDNINIHTTNIQQGVEELEDTISEALLRILNSVNQMQTT